MTAFKHEQDGTSSIAGWN